MHRVAFKIEWHPKLDEDFAFERMVAMWTVAKCYAMPTGAGEPLPVKVSTDHGRDRKRLLILTPYFVPVGQYHAPLEILNSYLLSLPLEVKLAREAEAKAAA